ncbi:MAG: response regulator [Chitinophagaceae bacterium]|jgi:two-component system LytT family response regulator|nr:response regulator [Chitinophagaceae bacterium]
MNVSPVFRAIIIDDEPYAVEALQMQLHNHCPQVQVVAVTTQSEEGETLIRKHRPDLLFLDIEMPKINGFQLLELVEDLFFHVIFTTAYDRYALRAFRFSALDYLLKPVDVYELIRAIERLVRRQPTTQNQIELLKEQMEQPAHKPTRIALPHQRGYIFQEIESIIYCEASNTYTNFYVEDKNVPLLVSLPLSDLEEMLTGTFFRIHREYLVHLKKIKELLRTDGGIVVMNNGSQLPLARNRRQELFDALLIK